MLLALLTLLSHANSECYKCQTAFPLAVNDDMTMSLHHNKENLE
jgi:hypothetical protein